MMQYLDNIIAGLIVVVGIILLALKGANQIVQDVTLLAAGYLFKGGAQKVTRTIKKWRAR